MFFVALRPVEDLNVAENPDFMQNLQLFEAKENRNWSAREHKNKSKLLFAEIYVRFHKEYSLESTKSWDIAYFKVATFDVLYL